MIAIRCLTTLAVVYMPVIVLYSMSRFPRVNRHLFALVMSLTIGLQLFILAIMFVDNLRVQTGIVLFCLALLGVYPTAYLLYPRHQARVERRLSKKLH
jgi:hypothetical protein